MKYVVARMHEGRPFDYIASVHEQTGRMNICTNINGALTFDTYEAAADAAGRAMDHDPHGSEYRAFDALALSAE